MPPLAPTTTPAGTYVRELRLDRGYSTQGEFAEAIGSTQETVSRVESGDLDLSERFAYKLITRVGADPDEVARYVDNPGWLARMMVRGSQTSDVRTNGPALPALA